ALPMASEAKGVGSIEATATTPFSTPWRVIIIGKTVGTIIESNLVYHLATPNKIGDVSWVKPGRASWSWWGDHASSRDFEKLKKFVDLAKEMSWEYSLVDANWDLMKGGDIKQLVDYANSQNIGLLFWYNSGGPHNVVTERPRDIMNDPVKRKEEFKRLHEWGVKGIKVDFFQSDKQAIIQLYHDILEDAAKEKIMVNFHGCTLPRGWSRTYPNLISMEAVRGAENYGWGKEFARDAPMLNNIYTYTRNVVGPMDYTPVTFSDYECCPHTTTNAHELALSVLFETGILHFADRAEPYRNLDSRIKDFMRSVPTVWDDTKFVQGEPGKETVLARRKGDTWYIAGASGMDMQQNLQLQLPFLTGSSYQASVFSDGTSAREIKVSNTSVKKGGTLDITVLPKGGFVAVLKP
ncbi:MAG: glycoside hydrolase family 97 catalytic domain-containing protein, partial [Flavisolibacter sp.]|nr:glycoside hydrolase family 97 catalytic domain-containing protein [Flavisolibacter sp.]